MKEKNYQSGIETRQKVKKFLFGWININYIKNWLGRIPERGFFLSFLLFPFFLMVASIILLRTIVSLVLNKKKQLI
ncbi:MAG: hypothetical protein IK041_06080 [Bacteroidales bacterium]|nr:hypothetical protein [Bacteroidales bacterium]